MADREQMLGSNALTVSEVARLANVSVRTLHHYDEIGLLVPGGRTDAGYRLYGDDDLRRLQEILLFRELEIPLEDIARLLAGGAFDRRAALELQHEMLLQKAVRTEALIASVERTINAERTGVRMTKEEMFEVFGDFDPAEYEEEVQERWGQSDAYKESARRTAKY
ncbi:MAG: MerR family transcriptional regulator, partial [Coriobacteriia bacterium]